MMDDQIKIYGQLLQKAEAATERKEAIRLIRESTRILEQMHHWGVSW